MRTEKNHWYKHLKVYNMKVDVKWIFNEVFEEVIETCNTMNWIKMSIQQCDLWLKSCLCCKVHDIREREI